MARTMCWHDYLCSFVVVIVVVVGLVLQEAYGSEIIINSTTANGCATAAATEPLCLKCGWQGCIKCPNLIVYATRKCVSQCPYGHTSRWSTMTSYMGRICISNGNFIGLSSEFLSILTGIVTGTLLSSLIIATAIMYIRMKRKQNHQQSTMILDNNSDLMMDDSPERRDFLKQLETLRPYAQIYLDMLNDTRRQLRELHHTGDSGAAWGAYKPVVRDLAKILLLLNRNVDCIVAVPDDWGHLFNWAEKALKRYKRMSEQSQPQVAQLISFLQAPTSSSSDGVSRGGGDSSTIMSTFKPDQVLFGSSVSLQHDNANVVIDHFNCNYDSATLNPQWKFEYSLSSGSNNGIGGQSCEFNPAVWRNSKEYLNSSLFLDDDFCQLGFRPQDEITTEL